MAGHRQPQLDSEREAKGTADMYAFTDILLLSFFSCQKLKINVQVVVTKNIAIAFTRSTYTKLVSTRSNHAERCRLRRESKGEDAATSKCARFLSLLR